MDNVCIVNEFCHPYLHTYSQIDIHVYIYTHTCTLTCLPTYACAIDADLCIMMIALDDDSSLVCRRYSARPHSEGWVSMQRLRVFTEGWGPVPPSFVTALPCVESVVLREAESWQLVDPARFIVRVGGQHANDRGAVLPPLVAVAGIRQLTLLEIPDEGPLVPWAIAAARNRITALDGQGDLLLLADSLDGCSLLRIADDPRGLPIVAFSQCGRLVTAVALSYPFVVLGDRFGNVVVGCVSGDEIVELHQAHIADCSVNMTRLTPPRVWPQSALSNRIKLHLGGRGGRGGGGGGD
eukprot:GHVU01132432.1.p1 GENE.GHVU01132432.1~~GHVU01132432.1.p1  ORF type:complete len:295 (-),score=47.26 GHVU01132432.1:269-1153(-)